MPCCVYWIHLPSHTNMLTEGYIGITTNFDNRVKSHKYAAKTYKKNHKLYNALRSNPEYIFEKVLIGELEYCLDVEQSLRPHPNIGLNCATGGRDTLSGRKAYDYAGDIETCKKISLALKALHKSDPSLAARHSAKMRGRSISEEQKCQISELRKGKYKCWENSMAVLSVWKDAEHLYNVFNSNPSIKNNDYARLANLKRSEILLILSKFRSGWNPTEDQAWVSKFK